MEESKNLIEGLQKEMNRVREMMVEYRSLPKGAGCFAASLMELNIKNAEEAISEGDAIKMIEALKSLKEYNDN